MLLNLRWATFCSAVCLVLLGGSPSQSAPADVGSLRSKYDSLNQELSAANPELKPARPQSGSLLFIAPDEYSPAPAVDDTSRAVRTKFAEALFELGRQAADAGQLSLAFQWATETLRENPDHAEARRVLGYEQRDGQWLTAYGIKMYDAGKHWDATRGWIGKDEPEASPEKAKADATRHADIKTGWQVRTDHFLVTSNQSLTAGAELAARLERLYQIWRQLFAGFYYSEKEVRGLFAGDRDARTQARPFRVFYHRDRESYASALQRRQPRIAETLGIYFDTFREAHFFAGDKRNAATLFHEAVHQLFQESKGSSKQAGLTANFWVVEGVATYFETLTEHDDPQQGLYFTVGEKTAGRLPAARNRLHDGFFIPLAELTKLNKDEVQRRPDVAKLYSQSSGLAAFLIDGDEGRYREALVRYLQAVYAGRDDQRSLSEAAETSYGDLDAQYRQYLESLP